jgi:hypothetical protein
VNSLFVDCVLSPDQRRNAPASVPRMPPRQTSDLFSQWSFVRPFAAFITQPCSRDAHDLAGMAF